MAEGYIFEFCPVGSVMRVNAVDPETGTEVSIVGPRTASQKELQVVAARKLRYVLAKRADADGSTPDAR
ncbi:MAG: hypothetical protein ACFB22_15080 [Rhodothalassiaceae bacterium]